MSPAELAKAFLVVTAIGRMIVAGDDTGVAFAKDFFEDLGAATGRDMEENGPETDKGSEVAPVAFVFPAGFVNVEGQGGGNIAFDGTDYRPQASETRAAALQTVPVAIVILKNVSMISATPRRLTR